MIRAGVFLLLLLVPSAFADVPPTSAAGFATGLAGDVFAAALAFMAPRTLEPIGIPQMTLWGLRGLTALDPALTPELHADVLRLSTPGGALFQAAAPAADDAGGWGHRAAAMAEAAWGASPLVRRAGTQGVISNFFDELFNHLDPYSRYEPPAEAAAARQRRDSQAGIGIGLVQHGAALIVANLLPDGPAAKAGIRRGDRLLAIDGSAPPAEGADAAAARIAGPARSSVALRLRDARGQVQNLLVQRADLPPRTVFASVMADLLVLRITGFTRETGDAVAAALAHGLAAPHRPRGVVFDLRGNRGGLLGEAVTVAGSVLGSGLVGTTAGRDPAANRVLQADGTDLSAGLPVVVLVDGRSASAAEIVAAALADDRRAVVVGSATLGKGLIQSIMALPDGGELLVSWSRVLAPLGWPIQGLGVMPQLCTSLGEAVRQAELDRLLLGEAPMRTALMESRTARAPLPLTQTLEIRSACPAAIGQDADLQTARMLIENPGFYDAALLAPQFLPPHPAILSGQGLRGG